MGNRKTLKRRQQRHRQRERLARSQTTILGWVMTPEDLSNLYGSTAWMDALFTSPALIHYLSEWPPTATMTGRDIRLRFHYQ